jgi:hypothetical protein
MATASPTPGILLPPVLQKPPDVVSISFKLRDCPFVDFHIDLDRGNSTVYDLMDEVAKHHGGTVEADKVQVFVKLADEEFRQLTDLTMKLSLVEGPGDVYYYDFNPVSGSLLIIPPEKNP